MSAVQPHPFVVPFRKPVKHRRGSKEIPLTGIRVTIYHKYLTITLPINAPQKKLRGKVLPQRKWEAVADAKGNHFVIGGTITDYSTLGPTWGKNLVVKWSEERPKNIVRWKYNNLPHPKSNKKK